MLGLLVAACVNRAPEGTFGAAVADVGVLDMLKVCKHPVHFFSYVAHIISYLSFTSSLSVNFRNMLFEMLTYRLILRECLDIRFWKPR